MTRLIFIRHGEPVGHEGRCVGHLDTELAPSAAPTLRSVADGAASPPRLVVSSDLRRCANCARILAGAWHAELRFDPRLRELSFGDWEGRTWTDIAETDRAALDAWGADWTRFSAPNGETGRTFESRIRAALDDLRHVLAQTRNDIVVVTHAGCIRVATTLLLNVPLETAFDRSIGYARAAVFSIDASSTTLDAWNVDTISADAARRPAPPSTRL